MGNKSSHTHEPLERGFTRGKFGDVKNGKSASFRLSKKSPKRMDRLRRSLRKSLRLPKDRVPESSKPHQWQADEEAVRNATCSFGVKYLGCVEVFESRGMQVCEEALKVLQNSRRRPVKGLLHVSGDGLRVVDDDTKGLIVDQTIEKVSFCAPDRSEKHGFSYICRDGTTRRWMCHGFLATKDSGERLSHAVGCAFAVCLERKQRRDKECGVSMTFDMQNSTFTRTGSFRQQTLTERLANNERNIDAPPAAAVPPQPKPYNPFAIDRPHATPSMLERQGSFRALGTIGSQSPFKRQMSLRINDLPSNTERQKAFLTAANGGIPGSNSTLTTPLRSVSPIPEVSPAKLNLDAENVGGGAMVVVDTVSQLCQELSQGLSLLSSQTADDLNFNNNHSINQNIIAADKQLQQQQKVVISTTTPLAGNNSYGYISSSSSTYMSSSGYPSTTPPPPPITNASPVSITSPARTPTTPTIITTPPAINTNGRLIEKVAPLPKPEQWLNEVVRKTSPSPLKHTTPMLTNTGRTQSLSAAAHSVVTTDPFDAEWVAGVTKPLSPEIPLNSIITAPSITPPTSPAAAAAPPPTLHHSTNPFISPPKPPVQSFQVQL